MYRGFQLAFNYTNEDDYKAGRKLFTKQNELIREELSDYAGIHGSIDGSMMEATWFPQVEADIFISHSHDDQRLAVTLSGWIYRNFQLTCFVDSTIWHYAGTLLKEIDNEYCRSANARNYDYEKRNRSTAHVHVMLSTALSKMMNSCECLFFINTPNSINADSIVNEQGTSSPWLYYELSMSRLVRRALKEHPRRQKKIMSKALLEGKQLERDLDISYPIYSGHLQKLRGADLNKWLSEFNKTFPTPDAPLDTLYGLF